jgi:hypothetical protein
MPLFRYVQLSILHVDPHSEQAGEEGEGLGALWWWWLRFLGPEADREERREQETVEGKRGKEKGEEMFFWLAIYSTTTFSLSRSHAATHGHPPICT